MVLALWAIVTVIVEEPAPRDGTTPMFTPGLMVHVTCEGAVILKSWCRAPPLQELMMIPVLTGRG